MRPLLASSSLALLLAACGSDVSPSFSEGGGSATSTSATSGTPAGSTSSTAGPGTGGGSTTGSSGTGGDGGGSGGGGGGGGSEPTGDPKTCEEAAAAATYLGCDFWPTVTANLVWSIFDYAVVVANAGDEAAEVTVERGGATVATATVAPNELETIFLPWVPELKGPDADCSGGVTTTATTSRAPDGAYHLVSSVPVTVSQFSPLEYAPVGGPPGKDWSECPGNACALACFSYSNDASLLFPSTSLTESYRVTGYPSWEAAALGAFLTITGVEDGTTVTVELTAFGGTQAGDGVPAGSAGGTVSFPLARGEVVQLFSAVPGDLSGSLVRADAPIQVLHGLPCSNVPAEQAACDHLEESVLPAEALGERYFVAAPTGVTGGPGGQVVRMVGNVNGTTLTYPGGAPLGAPSSLAAGQVVDLGIVDTSFEVVGSEAFAISTFLLGASFSDPSETRGDPSQSTVAPVEQFRTKHVFLAPVDYLASFVDVVMPMSAQVTLDGAPIAVAPVEISSTFGVARVPLSGGNGGAHVLLSTEPVGIQVIGYGEYTSYQYPGGLNLRRIAPPPG